jgi:hypothetical protein
MAQARIRLFELYSDNVGFWTHWPNPLPSRNWDAPFIIRVRAKSIRQAIWLAANRIRLGDPGFLDVGIVEVDHRDGPTEAQRFFRLGVQ